MGSKEQFVKKPDIQQAGIITALGTGLKRVIMQVHQLRVSVFKGTLEGSVTTTTFELGEKNDARHRAN